MRSFFNKGQKFKLRVTQKEMIDLIEESFEPSIWRLGMREFYVLKNEENKVVVSNKGQLETKFILELDEQKKLISNG